MVIYRMKKSLPYLTIMKLNLHAGSTTVQEEIQRRITNRNATLRAYGDAYRTRRPPCSNTFGPLDVVMRVLCVHTSI